MYRQTSPMARAANSSTSRCSCQKSCVSRGSRISGSAGWPITPGRRLCVRSKSRGLSPGGRYPGGHTESPSTSELDHRAARHRTVPRPYPGVSRGHGALAGTRGRASSLDRATGDEHETIQGIRGSAPRHTRARVCQHSAAPSRPFPGRRRARGAHRIGRCSARRRDRPAPGRGDAKHSTGTRGVLIPAPEVCCVRRSARGAGIAFTSPQRLADRHQEHRNLPFWRVEDRAHRLACGALPVAQRAAGPMTETDQRRPLSSTVPLSEATTVWATSSLMSISEWWGKNAMNPMARPGTRARSQIVRTR